MSACSSSKSQLKRLWGPGWGMREEGEGGGWHPRMPLCLAGSMGSLYLRPLFASCFLQRTGEQSASEMPDRPWWGSGKHQAPVSPCTPSSGVQHPPPSVHSAPHQVPVSVGARICSCTGTCANVSTPPPGRGLLPAHPPVQKRISSLLVIDFLSPLIIVSRFGELPGVSS